MYSQSPGYSLSYLLGRHLMIELRKDFENMSDKEFHDEIIYAGNTPFWFVREFLL